MHCRADQESGRHVAILEILNGAAAGQRYELASGQTVLGRDPFCDVILPLRSISRQHARILAERGQFYIEDLHSLNGTFVNGQRVAARSRLKDHDRIQLYETQMTFYETRPEPADGFGSEDALPADAAAARSTGAAARPRRGAVGNQRGKRRGGKDRQIAAVLPQPSRNRSDAPRWW